MVLEAIDEFDEMYDAEFIIWWYTREGFLYRRLNKALRQQNCDALIPMHFIIVDLYTALWIDCEKLKETEWTVQVYRGQLMSKEEISILKENTDYLLAVNSFLSASVDRDLVLIFSGSSSNCLDEDVQSVLLHSTHFPDSNASKLLILSNAITTPAANKKERMRVEQE
ncbi:unnamed protein product [Didymodactylos carnosus]|uniref:Uncharacterized protein n=1 Tax=Didymodactylos carnosus TaxID=1234261 RepID=A0A815AQU3_9BILA|nr:unnamed protein product [Didymodactylos carnosus]CAF4039335.1 unnamed protein product [Didymodactylos carnosus]